MLRLTVNTGFYCLCSMEKSSVVRYRMIQNAPSRSKSVLPPLNVGLRFECEAKRKEEWRSDLSRFSPLRKIKAYPIGVDF